MIERARPTVATHSVRYVMANVLVMIAGFVSFPIMTRLLDTQQYGIFGFYDAWLMILVGIFKLGGQQSILRFYPHVGGAGAMSRYAANFIYIPYFSACVLWLIALVVFAVITLVAPPEAANIGWLMLLLLPATIWISYASSFAFAQERSDVTVLVTIGQRWLEVFVVLGVVYYVQRDASGVYIARLVVTIAFALALWVWIRPRISITRQDFDKKNYLQGLRYGLPLVANEIAAVALSFIDRVMLRELLGSFTAVGVYAIGYGLAMNISSLLNYAIFTAYSQVSVREFETQGAAAVVRTKRAILHVMVYIVIAAVAGLICVGPDALLLLAGDDKQSSASVFVLIGINYVIDGLLVICTAGLNLHKRTLTMFALTLTSLLVNIVLNLIWIPSMGLIGAVYATLVSQVVFNVLRYFFCPRELRAMPDLQATLLAIAFGALTCGVAYYSGLFGVTAHLGRIGVMLLLTLLLFVLPALLIDVRLRISVLTYFRSHRSTAT